MILDILKTRHSVRKYQEKAIPAEVLGDILEAGRLSPSGGNEQPWLFGVVDDTAMITRIAEVAHGQTWIANAPLLIVLCTVMVEDARGGRDIQVQRYPAYAGEIGSMDHRLYGALNQEEHQTKIAGAHMALVAWEHGIGSCWVSRFDVHRLADLLNLPEGILPAEILVMGYPEKERKPTRKKPLEEIVFNNRYRANQFLPGNEDI